MEIPNTPISNLLVIQPKKIGDSRGFFSETFRSDKLEAFTGNRIEFVQDNQAYSEQVGVLRGLHFQTPPHAQAKLVRVVKGAIWDVAVDLRQSSKTYGQWHGETLSAENWKQLYIPEGFAHGYLTLSPHTEVLYKVTSYYHPSSDSGIKWDDPDLAIDWPQLPTKPIISAKDLAQPTFRDLQSPFA